MIRVSKYKRAGVWYLRYSKEIGLPRRSTGTGDRKQAEEIRRVEEHKYLFGHHQPQSRSILFSVFVVEFLQYKKGAGKAHATVESYRYALNNFGKSLKKDRPIHEITIHMIESFAAERRQIGRAEKTIRNELIVLVTAFNWAKRQRYIKESPCEFLELPKRVIYPPRYLTNAQFLKLKSVISDELFRDVIDLYVLTGMRRAEGTILLFSEHVDEEQGVVRIPQPKQRNYRNFPISEDLRQVLNRLRERSEGDQVVPFLPDHLTKLFGKYVRKANLSDEITFHALRHTFATWLVRAGVSMTLIQTLIGHSDPNTTKIYTHAYNEEISGAVEKLRLPTAKLKRVV